MKIYIAEHQQSEFGKILTSELVQKRVLAKTLDTCLCELDNSIELETDTLIISHPLRDDELNYQQCWQNHKNLITKRDDVHFYLFTLGLENRGYPRQEYIGKHSNLTYITKNNISEVFKEILLKGIKN